MDNIYIAHLFYLFIFWFPLSNIDKDNLKTRIIQDILTSMLRTDRNNDLSIDSNELRRLMVRLTLMPGFDFYQDRFLYVLGGGQAITTTMTMSRNTSSKTNTSTPTISTSYSIGDMMKIFRNLLEDDDTFSDNKEERVFVLKPKQLLLNKK